MSLLEQEVGIQPDSQTFGRDLIEKDISKNKYLGMRSFNDGLCGPSARTFLFSLIFRCGGRPEGKTWSVM